MGIVFKCAALGGFLYYLQIRRPEIYLRESMKARIGIEIAKWAIVIGFFIFIFAMEQFFIKNILLSINN